MIELPEAMVLARQINQILTGRQIEKAIANQSPHKFAWYTGDPAEYNHRLAGKTIQGAAAFGSHVEIKADDMILLISTPMRYHVRDEKPPRKHQLFLDLYDKVNWFRGALETMNVVYPQLWDVDFREQATQLEVPVYFLLGRHDVNAPPVLTEEYYELVSAPHKELIWFEHSGHNPWVSESAQLVDVVVKTVLAQTQPSQ
jgi:pimeloyl-ACP methyl ester carboxylesterase